MADPATPRSSCEPLKPVLVGDGELYKSKRRLCDQIVSENASEYLTFVTAERDFFFSFLASVDLLLTTPPEVGRSGSEQELVFEVELHKTTNLRGKYDLLY